MLAHFVDVYNRDFVLREREAATVYAAAVFGGRPRPSGPRIIRVPVADRATIRPTFSPAVLNDLFARAKLGFSPARLVTDALEVRRGRERCRGRQSATGACGRRLRAGSRPACAVGADVDARPDRGGRGRHPRTPSRPAELDLSRVEEAAPRAARRLADSVDPCGQPHRTQSPPRVLRPRAGAIVVEGKPRGIRRRRSWCSYARATPVAEGRGPHGDWTTSPQTARPTADKRGRPDLGGRRLIRGRRAGARIVLVGRHTTNRNPGLGGRWPRRSRRVPGGDGRDGLARLVWRPLGSQGVITTYGASHANGRAVRPPNY
jgi:beta-N-acetylhexosaminidase